MQRVSATCCLVIVSSGSRKPSVSQQAACRQKDRQRSGVGVAVGGGVDPVMDFRGGAQDDLMIWMASDWPLMRFKTTQRGGANGNTQTSWATHTHTHFDNGNTLAMATYS